MTAKNLVCGAIILGVSGCATASVSRLESRFVDFGLAPETAGCMARELDEDLDSRELAGVADFLEKIDRADRRPGALIDTLMSIDNPEIVASVAASAFSCALRR
jgi:hypothetical protein